MSSSRSGDKETFWLGWELVGDTDYAFHDGDAAVMGTVQVEPHRNGTQEQDTQGSERRDGDSQPIKSVFTICAPQLLHLDVTGRPLWFNGWLLPNKFLKDHHQQRARFEGFISEPRSVGDAGGWTLEKDNICCLSSDHLSNFTRSEETVLENIVEIGRSVGAVN